MKNNGLFVLFLLGILTIAMASILWIGVSIEYTAKYIDYLINDGFNIWITLIYLFKEIVVLIFAIALWILGSILMNFKNE